MNRHETLRVLLAKLAGDRLVGRNENIDLVVLNALDDFAALLGRARVGLNFQPIGSNEVANLSNPIADDALRTDN